MNENYFIQNMILRYAYWKIFYATVFGQSSSTVYAITVIFIYLLSDKACNTEFSQIFLCELYHT